jgi:mannan endo-1,4-beta-mannosidase
MIRSLLSAAVLVCAVVFGPVAHASPAQYVTRHGSALELNGHAFRFGAANIYWLGLDENVGGIGYPTRFRADDALRTARAMGAAVVRSHTLGISTGDPKSLEPSLDHFNDAAFASIDYAVADARRLGLHLVVPLTDNWSWYHGGRGNFTTWLGLPADAFYTDPAAIAAFERYIDHLLNHRNPLTGVRYRDDPTVMAWELGNELNGMTRPWVDEIAGHLKTLSPRHLVAAESQFGVDPAALAAPAVDIVEVHYYPPTAEKVAADAATITGAGKVYFAGEYGSTSAEPALMSAMAADRDVTGAAFWSLFAHSDDHGYVQHDDGFTLHYPGDDADMRRHADAIRAFGLAMAGRPTTAVPPPGRPLITHLSRTGDTVTLTWRGATTAGAYTIQRAANDRWRTLCDRCATDTAGTWTGSAGPGRYRVVPFTLAGTPGPASPVVRLT